MMSSLTNPTVERQLNHPSRSWKPQWNRVPPTLGSQKDPLTQVEKDQELSQEEKDQEGSDLPRRLRRPCVRFGYDDTACHVALQAAEIEEPSTQRQCRRMANSNEFRVQISDG